MSPLPELPDGFLCSMGGFPGVAYGLTLARSQLNQEPGNDRSAVYRGNFFAYLNREREGGEEAFARCISFIRGWVDSGVAQIVTNTSYDAEELLQKEFDPDVKAFLGKLLASGAAIDRSAVDEIMGALLWVGSALAECRENLTPENSKQAEVVDLAADVFGSVGLHCLYVRRLGGTCAVDY